MLICLCGPLGAAPRKLSGNAFKATIKAPGYNQLQRLGKEAGIRDARAHGKGVPLGGTRFLGLLGSRKKQQVTVVVVNGEGGKWRIEQRLTLKLKLTSSSHPGQRYRCEEDKISAVSFADDYDADGKPEALVRTLHCKIVPAIGPVKYRYMALINLGRKPSLALHFQLGYDALPTAMGAIKARARFKDINGDGHPDLVVNQREAVGVGDGDRFRWERSMRTFVYDPGTDRYTKVVKKKKKRNSKPARKR